MCPNGIRFYRNTNYRVLLARQASVGFEVVRVAANPERIGFLVGSGGSEIWYGPVVDDVKWFTGRIVPLTANYPQELNIEHYGGFIMKPWEFTLTDGAGIYFVAEITTPVDFK